MAIAAVGRSGLPTASSGRAGRLRETCPDARHAGQNGETMKQPTTKGLYDYWNAVRGARLAPRRYEIEPSQIVPFLSETIILERPESDACRVRIAGTRIGDWLGFDPRGQHFLELWRSEDREVIADNLMSISSHGAVGLFEFEARERGGEAVSATFEMLLLPLTHLEDRVERVLGSISIIAPPNFHGDAAAGLALASNRIIWPDGRPHGLRPEHQTLGAPPAIAAGVRRARLVRSDRRKFLVYDGGRAGE